MKYGPKWFDYLMELNLRGQRKMVGAIGNVLVEGLGRGKAWLSGHPSGCWEWRRVPPRRGVGPVVVPLCKGVYVLVIVVLIEM